MFFPEKIKLIKDSDHVLEVGPGGTPHNRANVLLEKNFDELEAFEQRGHSTPLPDGIQNIVYYDGGAFPFKDKEFDYVICSHVLEHIPANEIEFFVSELQRVAKAGYIEFPTIYYDYIYNFPKHLTFLYFEAGTLYFLPKMTSELQPFQEIQKFFYQTADLGYTSLIKSLKRYFFQGFEWESSINLVKASSISQVTYKEHHLEGIIPFIEIENGIKKQIIERLKVKFIFFYKAKRYLLKKFEKLKNKKFYDAVLKWKQVNGDESLRLKYDLDENSIVFDIGGYKGEFAENISAKYGSYIYIFEPVKSYYDYLVIKFKDYPKVKVFNFGLSGKDSFVNISLGDDASSLYKNNDNQERVALKDIGKFIELNDIKKIDLMKINIEGGEFDLLDKILIDGLQLFINDLQIQFHHFVQNAHNRRIQIRKKLSKTHILSYDYFFVWENWSLKKENLK